MNKKMLLGIAFSLSLLGKTLLLATPDMVNRQPASTPYDAYLRPVESVLNGMNGIKAPSFKKVSALVKQGFAFKYIFDEPYLAALPSETAARRAGDCKAKSLWLAKEMNDPSVRYVIGKARSTSPISHAWLMWKHNNRWWILDPTNASAPIPADKVGKNAYIIHYSYDQTGSYQHQTTQRNSVAGKE